VVTIQNNITINLNNLDKNSTSEFRELMKEKDLIMSSNTFTNYNKNFDFYIEIIITVISFH